MTLPPDTARQMNPRDTLQGLLDAFSFVLAEVARAEATNTRSPGIDYRCRQFFTDYGADLIAEVNMLRAALGDAL